MKLEVSGTAPTSARGDVLVVERYADEARLGPEVVRVDRALGGLVGRVLAAERFEAKVGDTTVLHADGRLGAGRVLVVGLGPRAGCTAETVRRAAAAAARRAREAGAVMGMGAFLGVNRGSTEPPAFIHLTYVPKGRPRRRIALVGKGITFDSGGLDLKTAEGMATMKGDMSGAAAVLGVMKVLPRLRPPVEVHGLVAATDNMPSGSATKPGDILRAMSGKTIEVNNTDAEGRLTLADAIAYARQEVKPDEIVDIATLTGACSIALGTLCAGAMTNDERLQARLLRAGGVAGERLWPLPLIGEYRDG